MGKGSEAFSLKIKSRLHDISKTGVLDLSGMQNVDLSQIGRIRPMKKLILANTDVKSLESLSDQPFLTEINADNSALETISGIRKQKRLIRISFENTPVSREQNVRLAVILASKNRVTSICNQKVTDSELSQAAEYDPLASKLANMGWVVVYPPPHFEDLQLAAQAFNISQSHASEERPIDENSIPISVPTMSESGIGFSQNVASILRAQGFPVRSGKESQEDIVSAIDVLCDTLSSIENYAKVSSERTAECQPSSE